MDEFPLPPMDRRLQARYKKMVKAHMNHSHRTAPGPKANAESVAGLSATQAAWRFLNNENVTLAQLAQPLQQAGHQAAEAMTRDVDLVVHDWCKIAFNHKSKHDTVALTHENDVGYELSTALLVSAQDGSPLAPMQMHLKAAGQIHSTCATPPPADQTHLSQVTATMAAARDWPLPRPVVHMADREADSLGHYRQWDQQGHLFLMRGDDRLVLWWGEQMLLSQVVQRLENDHAFEYARDVDDRGKSQRQYVAQTTVTLHRPARMRIDGEQRDVPGRPLELRFVVAQIRDKKGNVLAQWFLMTNVDEKLASAATVALWYYWRWRIESYFKLLKGAGHHMEQWQQETAPAIARRLLVASMACVVVWGLERRHDPEAEQLKAILVKLSGRTMKRTRPCTANALFAGLFVLLPLLELIETHDGDLSRLRQMALEAIPLLDTG